MMQKQQQNLQLSQELKEFIEIQQQLQILQDPSKIMLRQHNPQQQNNSGQSFNESLNQKQNNSNLTENKQNCKFRQIIESRQHKNNQDINKTNQFNNNKSNGNNNDQPTMVENYQSNLFLNKNPCHFSQAYDDQSRNELVGNLNMNNQNLKSNFYKRQCQNENSQYFNQNNVDPFSQFQNKQDYAQQHDNQRKGFPFPFLLVTGLVIFAGFRFSRRKALYYAKQQANVGQQANYFWRRP